MSQAKGGRSRPKDEPEDETGAEDPAGAATGSGHECLEWCPVCRSAELLRGVNSPEVRQQLQSIQNEALNVFKAFMAAYTERAAEDPFSRRPDPGREGGRPRPETAKPADEPIDISIE
jgi:hypothetical protein